MGARLNLVGQRFGRLFVLEDAGNRRKQSLWRCRCDCGKEVSVVAAELRQGDSKSCGCLHDQVAGARYRGKSTGPSGHRKDITGQRFGRLVVVCYSHTVRKQHAYVAYWNCRCDCGNDFVSNGHWMRQGRTVSCGCFNREDIAERARTHGKSKTREYRIWSAMITRCTNPNVECFKHYGQRGITVCARWRTSFENFIADMGPAPSRRHSVDRRDNDKGYSPDNCRWATHTEQARNKRTNVLIEINGETRCRTEWENLLGLRPGTLAWIARRDYYRKAPKEQRDAIAAFRRHVRRLPRVRCYWCGRQVRPRDIHLDHIVPVAKGGKHDVFNLCCSCPGCNQAKSSKLPEVFSGQFELFAG